MQWDHTLHDTAQWIDKNDADYEKLQGSRKAAHLEVSFEIMGTP
jgi:hypothetical protein